MKILIASLFIATSIFASEMQRIEAIVEDISKLRYEYDQCQKELKNNGIVSSSSLKLREIKYKDEVAKYKKLFTDLREENIILSAEVDYLKNSAKSIDNLKNKIKAYKKLLKTKENEIKNLKNEFNKKKCKSNTIIKKSDNSNKFPKLILKDKYKQVSANKEEMQHFKARAFRFKVDANIYDSIDGKVIGRWEKETSFTSNQRTNSWVRITGYFIDRKWLKAKKTIWVKSINVFQR